MRAGDLLGVEEAGDDGDGEVDVLDGEAREGARAVEVGARLVQVHAVAGQLRGLVPGGVGGLGRVREVGLGTVPGGGGHGGGWPDADEVILGDLDGVEGCLREKASIWEVVGRAAAFGRRDRMRKKRRKKPPKSTRKGPLVPVPDTNRDQIPFGRGW